MADVFAIATRVSALVRSRDRVQRHIDDRHDANGKPFDYGKPGYNAKIIAKLQEERDALNWAIEHAKKGN